MMRSETVIIESLFKKTLINVSINCMIESAVVKSILLTIFALKVYYLPFRIEKNSAEVLKYDFSCMKLLC